MSTTPELSKSAEANSRSYQFDGPRVELLRENTIIFDRSQRQGRCEVSIDAPEFTSLCPVTGQPDFGSISISYVPGSLLIESKALKLYLMSFRNHGAFHEQCVDLIAQHLIEVLDPETLCVSGNFNPRGGLSINPEVIYVKEEAEEQA